MRELLVATKNPGKFKEIREALIGAPFKLVFLGDLGLDDGDFIEDGMTFEENAEKKARYYFGKIGMLTLAEDSGIFVDALDGELGVKTRRWGAGEKASDREWIDYFMKRMRDVPLDQRGARFVCCACVVGELDGRGRKTVDKRGDGKCLRHFCFKGETFGKITETLEVPVKSGIPLSSCFRPDGFDTVYAALSADEKNKISHRGKAMAGVKKFLMNFET